MNSMVCIFFTREDIGAARLWNIQQMRPDCVLNRLYPCVIVGVFLLLLPIQ